LTAQERKILMLVAEGMTNKEIAAEVFLSDKTVKYYVSSILSKLNLERRAQAPAERRPRRPPVAPTAPSEPSVPELERVDDPRVGGRRVDVGDRVDLGALRLVVEHRGPWVAARLTDALRDGHDRRPAVPHLVDDEDPLTTEQRIGGELEERGRGAGLTVVVVVLDRGDEDVPDAQAIGEHPGGHHPAPGDREHH